MERNIKKALIEAVGSNIIAATDELTALDQAIGDGDHGLNMKRGFDAVLADIDKLADKPLGEMLKAGGMQLVMKVGGASGPLYGTLFMQLGKELGDDPDRAALAAAFASAIEAVMARGKSHVGQKTMLDVMDPVQKTLEAGGDFAAIRKSAADAVAAGKDMQATKGRASFLGERSIGHIDPGSRSSQIMINSICDVLEGTQT